MSDSGGVHKYRKRSQIEGVPLVGLEPARLGTPPPRRHAAPELAMEYVAPHLDMKSAGKLHICFDVTFGSIKGGQKGTDRYGKGRSRMNDLEHPERLGLVEATVCSHYRTSCAIGEGTGTELFGRLVIGTELLMSAYLMDDALCISEGVEFAELGTCDHVFIYVLQVLGDATVCTIPCDGISIPKTPSPCLKTVLTPKLMS